MTYIEWLGPQHLTKKEKGQVLTCLLCPQAQKGDPGVGGAAGGQGPPVS